MKLAKPDHQPYVTNLKKDIVFSPRHNLKLDAYLPPGKTPRPAVIIVHGGGWEAGDKVTYVTPLFEPLAKAGFAWFSIDYRLTPRFRNQEQLEDLRLAIEFVRLNSDRFQIDPNRIAILGESASGQMVAQLATEKPAGVVAVVSFYGVYDFLAMDSDYSPRSIPARLFRLTRASEYGRQLMVSFSPIYHVKADMPPLLLIHGTNERLLAQGVAMAQRLEHVRANYDLIKVENAPHGIENWEGHAEWLDYKTKLVDWLKAKLR
jgi:alpha-L-fucosidase 2